jgi:hypothetical protein
MPDKKIEQFGNEAGFELIAKTLGIAKPARPPVSGNPPKAICSEERISLICSTVAADHACDGKNPKPKFMYCST